jgi:predicted permease
MRFYRLLLHLYPASFRAEYGDEMCAIFAERRRNASRAAVLLLLWPGAVLDVVRNAVPVHLDILAQDLQYAARMLGRSPGFALTAILVAALGIGANTAAFTVTDHVLIRALPYPDSERLVKLWESPRGGRNEVSPPNFRDWRRMSGSFEVMAPYRGLSVNLVGAGDPLRLEGASVTADLFPMLGARAHLGRIFTEEDDRDGAAGTLLLSHRLWQTRFGGDSAVAGTKVLLDGAPFLVIGVMPADFHFPTRDAQIWTAMRFGPQDFEERNNTYLHVAAKLRRGTTIEQAQAEMNVIAAQLEREHPRENERNGVRVNLLRNELSERSRMLLLALVAASACVLLIACTNLANLLLARAAFRSKELAVRVSLGAGRDRLVRQLLTESLMLAGAGGTLGVLLAFAALPSLSRLVPETLPIAGTPAVDLRILGFALAATLVTGIGFGVLPALRACNRTGSDGLREGSRAGVGGHREPLRSALVIVQVTVSVVLLVSSGLLIRALQRLQAIDVGFRAENVLTLRTSLPMPKYERTELRRQFYASVLEGVRALPGVKQAGYISFLPIAMPGGIRGVEIVGRPQDPAQPHNVSFRFVTPGFFEAMGIPLVRGRDVSESDIGDSPFVAIVSESFARRYWPDVDPIGQRFRTAGAERRIAGVVGDIRVRGLERTSEPQVYVPAAQVPDGNQVWYAPKDLVIRTTSDAAALLPAMRRIVREADPEQPISDVRSMAEIVARETAPRRVQLAVLGTFAGIAFLLSGVGIYGLLSFTVSQRTQEIGVRIALGAQASDILGMVLRQGLLLAAVGSVIGAALGLAAGWTLQGLLAGVRPADPPTLAAAVGLGAVMTVAGSFFPALRAVRVDPAATIRSE